MANNNDDKNKIDYIFITPNGEKIEIESKSPDNFDMLKAYMEAYQKAVIQHKKGDGDMATYRTYKNGITGHRYKTYYIVKHEDKTFAIWAEDKSVLMDNIPDFAEAEWTIDKVMASDEEMELIIDLYKKEIYELTTMMMEIVRKRGQEEISKEEQLIYDWVVKVRKRKAEDRPF